MDRDDEVFLDAEEEVTPCRSGRKRRSTAGSIPTPATVKKPKTKMTTKHSPKVGAKPPPVATSAPAVPPVAACTVPPEDQDAFWTRLGGMLSGLESRMKH